MLVSVYEGKYGWKVGGEIGQKSGRGGNWREAKKRTGEKKG